MSVNPKGAEAEIRLLFTHGLYFTTGVFEAGNPLLCEVLTREPRAERRRVIVVVDKGVVVATEGLLDQINDYFGEHMDDLLLAAPPYVIQGGETAKNDPAVWEAVAQAIGEKAICRHSFVIAVGGGAVLDAVGYATSIAHRGVRLVRIPTTTLAQCDSGVGVKNGINAFGKKNFLGCFQTPWGVIQDDVFLTTLSDRDWRSGLSEIVKVALLKDPELFMLVEMSVEGLKQRDHNALLPLLQRSAELHFEHITQGGDPYELQEGRPLDFGHWAAHKLETMTDYQLGHGEAVAMGLAIDLFYAAATALLPQATAERIAGLLKKLGFALHHEVMMANMGEMLKGLDEFREHLGGRLTIPLIEDFGKPVEVHEIDIAVMIEAMTTAADFDLQHEIAKSG